MLKNSYYFERLRRFCLGMGRDQDPLSYVPGKKKVAGPHLPHIPDSDSKSLFNYSAPARSNSPCPS